MKINVLVEDILEITVLLIGCLLPGNGVKVLSVITAQDLRRPGPRSGTHCNVVPETIVASMVMDTAIRRFGLRRYDDTGISGLNHRSVLSA